MPAVVPAISTGWSGGWSCQARACASSKATIRAAGFIRPLSANQAGQAWVTISRNFRISAQCAAWAASTASGKVRRRSISARSASSIKAARSPASSQARSAVRGAPDEPRAARISRVSAARRCIGSTAGGRSTAPVSANGTSSIPPNAAMRGSSSGWPSEARKKASAKDRADRRVGSRIRPCALAIGALTSVSPSRASHPAAIASRNDVDGGILKRFNAMASACRRSGEPPGCPPHRTGRAAWTDGTTARHARRHAGGRRRWHDPRPCSC